MSGSRKNHGFMGGLAAGVSALALLAGCTVTPVYNQPTVRYPVVVAQVPQPAPPQIADTAWRMRFPISGYDGVMRHANAGPESVRREGECLSKAALASAKLGLAGSGQCVTGYSNGHRDVREFQCNPAWNTRAARSLTAAFDYAAYDRQGVAQVDPHDAHFVCRYTDGSGHPVDGPMAANRVVIPDLRGTVEQLRRIDEDGRRFRHGGDVNRGPIRQFQYQ